MISAMVLLTIIFYQKKLSSYFFCTALFCLFFSCTKKPHYTLVSHSYSKPKLGEKFFTTSDKESFSYRKFINTKKKNDTIIIALHGFCGASIDYQNLGQYLIKKHPHIGLYAYEIRGQGLDFNKARRGDIDQPENWYRDLKTFTSLVKKEHPNSKIVWQGESMGSMILAHTFRNEAIAGRKPPCDAIVITSPVVAFRDDFPKWKKDLARTAAYAFPSARLSLETISGGQSVQMTTTSTHEEQSETNSWNIDRHTLRLLITLGNHIEEMNSCAEKFSVPTLVVNGGKDYFSDKNDVVNFYNTVSQKSQKQHFFYPEAHHLLMYDTKKNQVMSDIANWIEKLPRERKKTLNRN
jgi:alpha-beta hydrolase superfamily lysophospholipase